MIKVRILTGVTAAASAALALPTLVGCSADPVDETPNDAVEQNNTAAVAGSGNIALHSYALHYASTSGGDEFLRVGEKMTVSVDFDDVLDKIAYRYDPAMAALRASLSDPSKIEIALRLTYTKFDEQKETADSPMTWGPGSGGLTVGKSGELVIPKQVKSLSVEVLAKYKDTTGVPQTVEIIRRQGIQSDFVVFGAFLPNKLALFDTNGGERRSRVVEGGAILKGSHATLSVTDWRLDTIVDKTSLDLRIGQKKSGSRFGPVVVDALGSLEYEVTAAVSTDGGASYQPIAAFEKITRPAVLARADGFRFSHERGIDIPGGAGPSLKIAFHVRAFLQVPSYFPGEIQNARYAPGSRILLRDVWDNNGGRDYALPIAAPSP